MAGLIGRKIGMTSIFNDDGKNIPCTVIEAGPCTVTQIKTKEKDGYEALQIGFGTKKDKNCSVAMKGHFKKAKTNPKSILAEFSSFKNDYKLGDEITVDIFEDDTWVDITGQSKGKGFQGVMKRYGFKGVGDRTHGQHDTPRAPGSLGASSDPSKVFKGMRMAGRKGGKTNKVLNLKKVKLIPEKNIIIVKGAVPGYNGSYLIIQK